MKFLDYSAEEGDIRIYTIETIKSKSGVSVSVCVLEKPSKKGNWIFTPQIGYYNLIPRLISLSPEKIEYKIEGISYTNGSDSEETETQNFISNNKEFELNNAVFGDRMKIKRLDYYDCIGKSFIWVKGLKILLELHE